MSSDLAFEIVRLGLDLIEGSGHSADTLLQIGQKTNQAYFEQTGRPIDEFLIHPELPV